MTIVAHPQSALSAPVLLTVPEHVELLDTPTLADFVDAGGDARPCRQTEDPEDYFPLVGAKLPKVGGDRYIEEQERARGLCEGCPVSAECLEFALRTRAGRHGVWGGSSEWERITIRTARLAAARAAKAAA
jgi:WhiB family transcriptional regulator, redox-sensing transcriptional regulator